MTTIMRALGMAVLFLVVHGAWPESGLAASATSQPVGRADLAAAYLRFERTLRDYPPPPKRIASINRKFDKASLAFFSGNAAAVQRQINDLTASLLPETKRSAEYKIAISLKLWPEPRTYILGTATACNVNLSTQYPVDLDLTRPIALTLRLRPRSGGAAIDTPLEIAVKRDTKVEKIVSLASILSKLVVATYDIELVTAGDIAIHAGQWVVAREPFDKIRNTNENRLAAIKPDTPALKQALAICSARNRLLLDVPSDDDSAQFLADPTSLAPEVDREIRMLAAGQNPYHRRRGDYWRVVPYGDSGIPMRVYVPDAAATDVMVPLVIALHGAGGDENMFPDGYGAGRIKALADKHRFIVASPRVYSFFFNAAAFDRLVKSLAVDYAVDGDRVYVLGHSMGAGAAMGLARSRPGTISAACCLAGGGSLRSASGKAMAPTLVFAGQLDPLASAGAVEAAAKRAIRAGLPIEFRLVANYGHTLMVGEVLPDAVAWLLSHQRVRPTTRPTGTRASTPPAKSDADEHPRP